MSFNVNITLSHACIGSAKELKGLYFFNHIFWN
jgi:hypothetical protein